MSCPAPSWGGASKRFSAVRWGVGLNIFLAWIITLPMAALFSAAIYFVLQFSASRPGRPYAVTSR
jgi:phosphate/sulfate permease